MSLPSSLEHDSHEIGQDSRKTTFLGLFMTALTVLGLSTFIVGLCELTVGPPWLVWGLGIGAAILLTSAFLVENKYRGSVDADRIAEQVISDFRDAGHKADVYDVEQVGNPSYPNLPPADISRFGGSPTLADLQVLQARFAEELRTQLSNQQKNSLLWSWFFFLAGILVAVILPHIVALLHL